VVGAEGRAEADGGKEGVEGKVAESVGEVGGGEKEGV